MADFFDGYQGVERRREWKCKRCAEIKRSAWRLMEKLASLIASLGLGLY